jgi:hypothetical protein
MYDYTPTPPPKPEPKPKQRNGGVLALVVAAVAVLLVGGTLLFVRLTTTIEGQALPAAVGPATTSSSKPGDPLQPKPTGGPLVPGWHVVELNDGDEFVTDKAYDVPSTEWEPTGGGASITWGKNQEVRLYIPSVYRKNMCPDVKNSWQSLAGVIVMPNKGDIKVGAPAALQLITDHVFAVGDQLPKVEMGAAQPVTVYRNKNAVMVTAKVTVPDGDASGCPARSATVVGMMMPPNKPGDDTSVGLVAMTIQDAPGATPDADLQRIVTSIHDIS